MAKTYEVYIDKHRTYPENRMGVFYDLNTAKKFGVQNRESEIHEVLIQEVIRQENDEVITSQEWKLIKNDWVKNTP